MRRGCPWLLVLVALITFSTLADHGIRPHPKILWNVKAHAPSPDQFYPSVNAVEFSPDGEQIISAGYDGAIKFLSRSDGAVSQTILAHTGAVYGLSISKDGLLLASGGVDRMLNLWRVSDGTLLRSINAHTTAVYSVAFSPDASLVISGGGLDNQLKIWRTANGELVRSIHSTWGRFGGIRSVAFAPNAEYVAGSGLEVWRLDGTRVGDFSWDEATTHVKFTADSTRVFGTIPYGIVGYIIADAIWFIPRSTASYPPSAISPDGRSLISATSYELIWAIMPPQGSWFTQLNNGEIQSYDCADGECLLWFSSFGFDPRMRTLAAGTGSGEVLLFELPIWISGVQRDGNRLDLQWQGGSGYYQLQKLTTPDAWRDIGAPLTNNAASVNMDDSAMLLRVKNIER